jgi:hypothetical protein
MTCESTDYEQARSCAIAGLAVDIHTAIVAARRRPGGMSDIEVQAALLEVAHCLVRDAASREARVYATLRAMDGDAEKGDGR